MKRLKQEKLINFRVSENFARVIKELGINISEVCREALLNEIKKIKKVL